MPKIATPEQIENAERLLADGTSIRATAKLVGLSPDTISRRVQDGSIRTGATGAGSGLEPEPKEPPADTPPQFERKRKPDPAPRAAAPRRRQSAAASSRPSDEQLEDALRKTLKMCSMPMRLKCAYCANHMQSSAAIAARKAIEDADIRDLVEKVYVWCDQYAGAGWLIVIFGVPAIHHLAPEFIYRLVGPTLGMPARHSHQPAPAPYAPAHEPTATPTTQGPTPAADAPPAAAEPEAFVIPDLGGMPIPDLTGLDTNALVEMAGMVGLDLDPEMIEAVRGMNAAAATAAAEPAARPEGAAAQAPPAEPVPNA